MSGGQKETGTGHPKGMAKRDRASVRVDPRIIIRNAELAEARERLRSERFIELDDAHAVERKSRPLQRHSR